MTETTIMGVPVVETEELDGSSLDGVEFGDWSPVVRYVLGSISEAESKETGLPVGHPVLRLADSERAR